MPYRICRASVLILIFRFAASTLSQSPTAINLSNVTPETAFVSRSQYTNAFFGFSLPLPQGAPLQEFSIRPGDASKHFLFGVKALTRGLSMMTVGATKSENGSAEEARKASSGPNRLVAKPVEIGGREFWKCQSQENGPGGKMRRVCFASVVNGYVLQFNIDSFDARLAEELQRSIEAITFFDPEKAQEVAGPGSRAYNPAATHSPQ